MAGDKTEYSFGDWAQAGGATLDRAMSGYGKSAQYSAQAGNLRLSSTEMRRQAKEEMASTSVDVNRAKQQTALALSRAQAVSAAQGSPIDANVLKVMADFEVEGRVAALTKLYEGKQKERALLDSAENADREAAAQDKAASKSKAGAVGALIGGIAGSFFGPAGTAIGSSLGSAIGSSF